MKKTIGRDLPGGVYVEIEAEERDGSLGLSPGFAVTGMLWEKQGTWDGRACRRNGRDCVAAGQITDEIREAAPELAPIMAVHLADPSGLPMHALANGWYFYSGAAANYERAQVAAGKDYGYSRMLQTSNHDRAAQALHIAPSLLPAGLSEAEFAAFVESLADTYAGQAQAARDALARMVDGDGVEDVLGGRA